MASLRFDFLYQEVVLSAVNISPQQFCDHHVLSNWKLRDAFRTTLTCCSVIAGVFDECPVSYSVYTGKLKLTIAGSRFESWTGRSICESFEYHSYLRDQREREFEATLELVYDKERYDQEVEDNRRYIMGLTGGCSINRTLFRSAVAYIPSRRFPVPTILDFETTRDEGAELSVLELDVDGGLFSSNPFWGARKPVGKVLVPTSWLELDCIRFTVRLSASYLASSDCKYRAGMNMASQWYEKDRQDLEEFLEEELVKRVRV